MDESRTEVTSLVKAYLSELDFDARLALAKELQAEIYANEPVLPILYPQSHWGFTDSLEGIDSLLISVSSQEWNLVKLEGFTKNDPSANTDNSDEDDSPLNTFAVVSAIFFSVLITTYRRRT